MDAFYSVQSPGMHTIQTYMNTQTHAQVCIYEVLCNIAHIIANLVVYTFSIPLLYYNSMFWVIGCSIINLHMYPLYFIVSILYL